MVHAPDPGYRPPFSTPGGLDPASLRGGGGCFRIGRDAQDRWWFLDHAGRRFFSCGINAVRQPESWSEGSAEAVLARLDAWHVNTLGHGSDPELREQGLAFTECVEFRRRSGLGFRLGEAHLPDVFDPRWPAACDAAAARVCPALRDRGELIGYYTDDELGWAQFGPAGANEGRPTLLQLCLSLEPAFAAYHAAWEFVLATRGGQLALLADDWAAAIPNRETIRQLTLADVPLTSPGYRRDHDRFSEQFARRYFRTTAESLRRHDPDHLILGCRFAAPPARGVAAACAWPHVDVLSFDCSRPTLPDDVAWYHGCGDMPVLVGAFDWAGDGFTRGPDLPPEPPHLSELERMHRRGRAAVEAALAHPALVGYSWRCWTDTHGGDRPPFGVGLVEADGRPALEHVQPLAALNAAAENLHASARSSG